MDKVYEHLKELYTRAIEAVNPYNAVKNVVTLKDETLLLKYDESRVVNFDLREIDKVFIVGAGKATAPMARVFDELLGERITKGLVCVKYGYGEQLQHIESVEASHPVPDEAGREAAFRIKELLAGAGEKDLVISLISGGGSALLPLPPEGITLKQKIETTDALLRCGAPIHEMNALRKHISLTKGGNLAQAACPATVINLMISDVVGDNLDVIASGPFVPDTSSYSDALEVLKKYNLESSVPAAVVAHLRAGAVGEKDETPKQGEACFEKVYNVIASSNLIALKAAERRAKELGYQPLILSSFMEGETKEAVVLHSAIAREIKKSGHPLSAPACILSGGENTVTIEGNGKGGRNTEFALQAALAIEGIEGIYAASIATDGSDGPTDAAGALVDYRTVRDSAGKGLDVRLYGANNDSYTFFEKLGTLVKTGPTKTNVMDIHIFIVV